MIRHYFRKLGKSERGATAVEFAIVALLLFTLIFGIIEFGWLFFGWITLTGAVREGARRAIVGEDDVIQTVINHAPIVHFDSNSPAVSIEDTGSGSERIITVAATGEIQLLTGLFSFISNTDHNTYEITAVSIMRYESGFPSEATVINNQ